MQTLEATGVGLDGNATAFVERADGTVVGLDGFQLDFAALAGFGTGGVFIVECYSDGGELRWVEPAPNGVTSPGLDYILNVAFRGVTPITTWYIGLVDGPTWSGYNSTDTIASHTSPNTWSENSSFSNSVRPTWSPGAPSGNAIVNGTTADFNMNPGSAQTIKGLFLISDNTKAGTTLGTLFSTASFTGGTQTVNNGDTLKVTYTLSAANAAGNS